MSELSNPQLIAEEYLREDRPALQQRNALTLLRALTGSENALRIAKEAIANRHPDVRQRAVDELAAMSPPDREAASQELRRAVDDHTSETAALRAYTALGKLGKFSASSTSGWWKARLEMQLFEEIFPIRGMTFHTRTLIPATIATTVASIMMLSYVAGLGLLVGVNAAITPLLIITAMVATCLTAPLLTARSIAVQRHFHRPLGLLIECACPIPFLFIAYALAYVISALSQQANQAAGDGLFWGFFFPFLVLSATAFACRLGTMLSPAYEQRGRLRFMVSMIAGASLGTIVLTTLLWLRPESVLAAYWPTLVPVWFGLAAAFAKVETQDSGRAGNQVAWQTAAASLAFVAFAGVMWLPIRSHMQAVIHVDPDKLASIPIPRLPNTLHFSLTTKTGVYFAPVIDPKNAQGGDTSSNDDAAAAQDSGPLKLNASLADGQNLLIPSANPPPDLQASTSPMARMTAQRLRATAGPPGTIVRDVPPGHYSISVWDGRRPANRDQSGMFSQLFGAQARRKPLPNITATLMLAKAAAISVPQPTYLPVQGSLQVTKVPFIQMVHVGPTTAMLEASLHAPPTFGGVYQVLVRKVDSKAANEKSKVTPDGNISTTSRSDTFDDEVRKTLTPGDWLVAVDRRHTSTRLPLWTDKSDKTYETEIEATLPGVELTFGAFSIPKELQGQQGTTRVPATGTYPGTYEVPGLPYSHVITVIGGPRRVSISFDDKSLSTNIGIFSERGVLIDSDSNGSLNITRELEDGTYCLIVTRSPLPGSVRCDQFPRKVQTPIKDLLLDIY